MKPTHYLIAAMALAIAGLVAALALEKQQHAESREAWTIERKDLADAARVATEKARTAENTLNTRNLEIANEQARLQADATRRIADAQRATAGLRDTLYALSRRERPADPAAAGWFDAANTARRLVGECSDRRTEVAAAAHELRAQVTGLQQYVAGVCLAANLKINH